MAVLFVMLLPMAVAAWISAAMRLPREWGARDRRTRRQDGALERVRAETAAETEEHDIDDMLNAIEERRRRRGARPLGEELADDLERGTWEE